MSLKTIKEMKCEDFWKSHMLGTSKKGKNPKFEDLKIFKNLEILFSWELFFVGSKQSECLELRNFFFQSLENLWNFVF